MKDVAVVPGAAVKKGGRPGIALSSRIDGAVDLYHAGEARNIIVSGGIGKHPPSEAEVMRDIAVGKGVPEDRIFLETRASSTLENAKECARIIRRNTWKNIVLVTDRYHAFRTRILFRIYGIKASTFISEPGWKADRPSRFLFLYAREFIALAWNIFKLAVLFLARKL